jgi:ABC-type sulfate transport system substrate-binding protein
VGGRKRVEKDELEAVVSDHEILADAPVARIFDDDPRNQGPSLRNDTSGVE